MNCRRLEYRVTPTTDRRQSVGICYQPSETRKKVRIFYKSFFLELLEFASFTFDRRLPPKRTMGPKTNNRRDRNNKGRKQQPKPRIVESISDDSDDEEISEDEAFNSDDERKYGSFFSKGKKSADDKDEGEPSDGDDSESNDEEYDSEDDGDSDDQGDGGQYMLDLLNRLDSDNSNNKSAAEKSSLTLLASNMQESEFSASVLPKAGLTLDSLMEEIKTTKGFGSLQKTMKKVVQGKATSAPVAQVVSERAKRKVHYKEQSAEISQWMDIVQQNRKAETLDFRPKDRLEITRDVMIEKFVPTTDFEKEINEALEKVGQKDEEAMIEAEEAALHDDLGANEISIEEYKKRRGQLAKMRALLFYHEQKRHQINKIKSKKYRRIRKNQRNRQKQAETDGQLEEDPDLLRELEEKEELERMKERMTLAHKNTSKWAKRVLKRGKNVDIDTRRALSAQLKRGDDLLKKMNLARTGDDSDDDDENLVDAARKVLSDTENGLDEEATKSGLFNLAFMQKGLEKQREAARKEARLLLLELEANEHVLSSSSDDEDEDDDDSVDSKLKDKIASNKTGPLSKADITNVLKDGEMVASALQFGSSTIVKMASSLEVSEIVGRTPKMEEHSKGNVSEHVAMFSTSPKTSVMANDESIKQYTTKHSKAKSPVNEAETSDSNPWLVATTGSTSSNVDKREIDDKKSTKLSQNGYQKKGFIDVDRAIDMLADTPKDALTKTNKSNVDVTTNQQKITTLTQEQLVRKAFVTISEQEAEEEFAREKVMVEIEESERKSKKKLDNGLADGWGSWAGAGAPPPPLSRNLPAHLQPPKKKPVKREREHAAAKPNVIINQKRLKKMADSFMIAQIPYPYTSREEYERSMTGGVGREWNVTSSFKDMTRQNVITRPGKIIQPISKKSKQTRAPAKF